MKKILLTLLLFTSLFSIEGRYKSYFSVNIGSSSISRDYSVEMKNDGIFLNKETGEKIKGEKGETYSFNEKLSHTKIDLIYGVQKDLFGDFYEIGFFTSSIIDEVFVAYGRTLPSMTFSKKWFNPFVKFSLGIGFTGSKDIQPTSLSYGLGVGILSSFGESFQGKLGFDLKKRNWSDISHSYGQEVWEEQESTLYLGLSYLY